MLNDIEFRVDGESCRNENKEINRVIKFYKGSLVTYCLLSGRVIKANIDFNINREKEVNYSAIKLRGCYWIKRKTKRKNKIKYIPCMVF